MTTTPRRKTIGIRSTRQRAAVEDTLADLPRFASAGDIHRRILDKGESVGLTTVYRTLQALADAGEVDVLNSLGGEALYRKCNPSTHHHHLVCTNCGAAVEIDGGPSKSGRNSLPTSTATFSPATPPRCLACARAATVRSRKTR